MHHHRSLKCHKVGRILNPTMTFEFAAYITLSALTFSPDTCPNNASYYGNRAATLMMLGRFREALGDAQQSVRLDDSFVRVCGKNHIWYTSECPCFLLLQLLQLPFNCLLRAIYGKGSAIFP